jgi:chromosome segregation ATPase
MKYIQYDPAEFDKITVAKADDVDALKACIAELEAQNEFIMSANNELSWALKERDEATAHYKSLRARIAELEAELTSEQDRADRIARELDALRWEQEASAEYTKQMRKALKDTTVCLVAAVSLLESGGKKAAPSNKMFEQMLDDYKNSIERGRAALEKKND